MTTTKRYDLLITGLLIPMVWLLPIVSANAQTETTIQPVKVAGMRGSVETRNLFINATKPITNPQPISLDLSRSDGQSVLPASAITVQADLIKQPKPNQLSVPVNFNLQQVPSSGEFSGNLRLSYQDGEAVVPVTVSVKDYWLLPLVILLVGTGLGIAVSAYRSQGQPKDEILVRVGRLRSQMQEERELEKASPFQSQIEAYLYDVKMALQGDRLDTGRSAIEQAELVWSKWIKGRGDWLAQLGYRDQLNQRLQDLNPNIPYVQTVQRGLENVLRQVPNLEGPDKLRDRLDELAQQINRYFQLQSKIKQANTLLTTLPSEQANVWRSKIQILEQQIGNLQPADLEQYTAIQTGLDAAITELTQLVIQSTLEGVAAKGLPGLGVLIPQIAPAPSANTLSWETQASVARQRLKLFKGASYAIAIVFLAGAGFSQLYVDNPTFGANPWKDYFALLAWGFGAEASREAVTKVVQGWGLPGAK